MGENLKIQPTPLEYGGYGMDREEIEEKTLTELLSHKTAFERAVLLMTFQIPEGKISTYQRIAQKIGRPRAYRAVGNALHRNPFAPIIPCHRVIRSDGKFGGNENEADLRMHRLKQEGIHINKGRVTITEQILF
jgi:O-6-methylguanine DNA methyltransferase